VLTEELAAAEAEAQQARAAARSAALALLAVCSVPAVVDWYHECRTKLAAAVESLRGFSWASANSGVAFPRDALAVLVDEGRINDARIPGTQATWQARVAALLADPDAPLMKVE
jgi:hypothetical protein